MDQNERRQRLDRLEAASEKYVVFCGVICFVAFILLGWPALIAWAGLAWAMDQFCQAMRGSTPTPRPQQTRHTKKSKGRCCD
ncbi:MAG: hypothetical protein JWP89_401 [Schlesneria sp.]|nr:hypothetical protein [Schlesneria sp.]